MAGGEMTWMLHGGRSRLHLLNWGLASARSGRYGIRRVTGVAERWYGWSKSVRVWPSGPRSAGLNTTAKTSSGGKLLRRGDACCISSGPDKALLSTSSHAELAAEELSTKRKNRAIYQRSLYGRTSSEIKTPTGVLFQHVEELGIKNKADGAVMVSHGGTSLRAVCVINKTDAEANFRSGFLPMSVEYRDRAHASGNILKSKDRREYAGQDPDILIARSIDRSLRPLFPKGFFNSVQLTVTLESYDGKHDPETLAINACSAAVDLTGIDWHGPVGAMRMSVNRGGIALSKSRSRTGEEIIVGADYNPRSKEMNQNFAKSDFTMCVSATGVNQVVVLEGKGIHPVPESMLTNIILRSTQRCVCLVEAQRQLKKGRQPIDFKLPTILPTERMREAAQLAAGEAAAQFASSVNRTKRQREYAQIQFWKQATDNLGPFMNAAGIDPDQPSRDNTLLQTAVHDVLSKAIRKAALDPENPHRPDGRRLDEVRKIKAAVDVFPSAHASSVFSRGDTQVVCSLALGSPSQSQEELKSLSARYMKPLSLTYSFPPYSVGRTGPVFGKNRRNIGHGDLAERALISPISKVCEEVNLLPCDRAFPYAININCEVTSSDGSSSLASVCAGALALMDASVPMSSDNGEDKSEDACESCVDVIPAACSIGLYVDDSDESFFVLPVDLLGLEDHFGDMDFKIAGTNNGVTALQLDIKRHYVSVEMLEAALTKARIARGEILNEMVTQTGLDRPRYPPKKRLPCSKTVNLLTVSQVQALITNGSKLKHQIEMQTRSTIEIMDAAQDTRILVVSPNKSSLKKCISLIRKATSKIDFEENNVLLDF